MATIPQLLKDPRTCRVFISSPFGGCETEREELGRKYYPQLSHLCQSKGVQFVPVDMRWGITEESATDAQVIVICLREIDRSDIFVGFYGQVQIPCRKGDINMLKTKQRYGWHGTKDSTLQKNIDNALDRYPWLSKVKDRSVTEIEFLHGHLNNPGALPAIIAFRNKTYDDTERVRASKSKDAKKAMKFDAESEESKILLEDLKQRVIETKTKCLALNERYTTPEEGANFVFEQIKKHLETVLLKSQMSLNKREMDLASHDAYMLSRVSIFVGGEDHEVTLDTALEKGNQNVLIFGPTGAGKGALLAHWLSRLRKESSSKYSLIYHFAGCSSDSASIPEVLTRLIAEINHVTGAVKKSRSDNLQQLGDEIKPKPKELSDLYREFELVLAKSVSKRNILLVFDGVGKVRNASRIAKTLFWLPSQVPRGVTIVCTCRETDTSIIEELRSRGYNHLYIPELNKALRRQMCMQLLTRNSKELSAAQLQKIVDSEQSGSPLYLKTVISELCAFGQFRELDAKINQLIACQSVKELFQVFIQRLEADHKTSSRTVNIIERHADEGGLQSSKRLCYTVLHLRGAHYYGDHIDTHLVRQAALKRVLCCIRVSRHGLSENELMAMHDIPSKEWSPLFFAMQHVMIEVSGLLKFGFHELTDAVDERYMKSRSTKLKYQKIVSEYFDKQRKKQDGCVQIDHPSLMRPADELPWLLCDMGDTAKLKEVLADLSILGRLFIDQEFELLQLWRCTGLSGDQIADLYLEAIQTSSKNALKSAGQTGEHEGSVLITLLSYLNALSYFMEMASYRTAHERVLLAEMDILEKAASYLPQMSLKRSQIMIKTKLAYLYTDVGRYEEAATLHGEVLEYRQKHLQTAVGEAEQHAALKGLASIYHGIAMLNSKLDKINEAIDYYTKAMEVQKQLDDEVELADSLHNLGVMYIKIGKYRHALELCSTSLKIYQNVYFANLPPVIGVMMGNIAVCHRHLGQVDQAEVMYMKALEIAERAVGRQHPHVALGLMNLGTLEINRQQFTKAETYIRECIDIFEKCETLENDPDYYKSIEKFVYVLLKVNKLHEAIDRFQMLYRIAVKEKFIDTSWPNVYVPIVDCLIELKQFKFAHDVVLTLLKSKQAQDKSYIQYDTICKAINLTPKQEYSVESALREKPGSLTLLRHTIETKFIPEGSIDKIIKSLDEADRSRKVGRDLYGTAVTWCEEVNRPDLALAILEYAIELFPDEATFVCGLAQYYYENENWEKAKEYSGKMCKMEPQNPNHFLLYGDMALRTNDLHQAKRTFSDMLNIFASDGLITSQARNALDMLNKMEMKRSIAND